MSWDVLPCVYPVWDSVVSWSWVAISFPILGKFSTIISSRIFSWSFFLSSSGTPIIRMLEHFILSWRSLRLSSFLLILFFYFFLSDSFISTIQSSNSLILSSASVILPFIVSRVFLISFSALFIIH